MRPRHAALAALVVGSLVACESDTPPLAPEADEVASAVAPLILAGEEKAPVAPGGAHGPSLVSYGPGGTTILDFEEYAGPTNVNLPSYSGGGFSITLSAPPPDGPFGGRPGTLTVIGLSSPFSPGSASALINDIRGLSAILRKEDGGAFTVLSVDVAPFFTFRPADVTFVGTLTNGQQVTHHVTVPAGGGLQTVALAGFGPLLEMRWQQIYPGGVHQFDNIVIGPPNPATADD